MEKVQGSRRVGIEDVGFRDWGKFRGVGGLQLKMSVSGIRRV